MKTPEELISDYCDCINKLWQEHDVHDYEKYVNTTYILWDHLVKESKFKDSFEFYWSAGAVVSVTAKSTKTGCHFMIGLDLFKKEIYFDNYVRMLEIGKTYAI